MKINKCICDICGKEITTSHPTRLEQHEYQKDLYRPVYKKVIAYDICDKCCDKLPGHFRALREDK